MARGGAVVAAVRRASPRRGRGRRRGELGRARRSGPSRPSRRGRARPRPGSRRRGCRSGATGAAVTSSPAAAVTAHRARTPRRRRRGRTCARYPSRPGRGGVLRAAGRHQSSRLRSPTRRALERPTPRGPGRPSGRGGVRDRDRLERRPGLPLAQPGEHARPAVEQQAAGALDEVARTGPTGVGPGGRATDDGNLTAIYWRQDGPRRSKS